MKEKIDVELVDLKIGGSIRGVTDNRLGVTDELNDVQMSLVVRR